MKNNSKKSLQEIILNFLSRKKAIKKKDLHTQVEIFIENYTDNEERKTKPKYLINRTIKKMIDDNIIDVYETNFSSFLSLTKAGRHKLRNIKLSSQNHLVSVEWDGYWRIAIIDIPETRKSERDALRYILKKAQFVQIKSSVWISPFPMEHIMIEMKEDLNLHEELMIFVTNMLDEETEKILQRKFSEYNS